MRIYDTRIARFLCVDQLMRGYPELTPYQFASNTPIESVDLDGLESKSSKDESFWEGLGNSILEGTIDLFKYAYNNPNHSGYDIHPKKITKEQIKQYEIDFSELLDPEVQIRNFAHSLTYGPYSIYQGVKNGDGRQFGKGLGLVINAIGTISTLRGILLESVSTSIVVEAEASGGGVNIQSRSINPKYSGPRDNNCAGVAEAANATMNGFPAFALNNTPNGTTVFDVLKSLQQQGVKQKSWFAGFTQEKVMAEMMKLGEGSTGIIFGYNGPNQMGHYFNVTVKNGKVVFLDFQKVSKSKVMSVEEVSSYKDL